MVIRIEGCFSGIQPVFRGLNISLPLYPMDITFFWKLDAFFDIVWTSYEPLSLSLITDPDLHNLHVYESVTHPDH